VHCDIVSCSGHKTTKLACRSSPTMRACRVCHTSTTRQATVCASCYTNNMPECFPYQHFRLSSIQQQLVFVMLRPA